MNFPRARTCIFGKVVFDRNALDLLLKQINLIEEENDGGFREPSAVDNRFEQDETLRHAILRWIRTWAGAKQSAPT